MYTSSFLNAKQQKNSKMIQIKIKRDTFMNKKRRKELRQVIRGVNTIQDKDDLYWEKREKLIEEKKVNKRRRCLP